MRFARCWFTALVGSFLIGAGTASAVDAPAPPQSPQAPRKELKFVSLQMNVSAVTREGRVAGRSRSSNVRRQRKGPAFTCCRNTR